MNSALCVSSWTAQSRIVIAHFSSFRTENKFEQSSEERFSNCTALTAQSLPNKDSLLLQPVKNHETVAQLKKNAFSLDIF